MFAAVLLLPATLVSQGMPAQGPSVEAGKTTYGTLCAGCHGVNGIGTEHAPKLADNPDLRGRSIEKIHGTIAAGFPASGMPPFGSLPPLQIDELAAYVSSLNLSAAESAATGNAAAGRQFFWHEGLCNTCHMVHGMGSATGPDLSDLGLRLSAKQIRDVLLSPDLHITPGYGLATVQTREGITLRGYLRNATNYDVHVQDLSGAFHLLPLSDVTSLTKDKHAAMKPLHAAPEVIENLTAYLGTLSGVEPGALAQPNSQISADAQALNFGGILNPKSGDWPTYNGRLSGNRYSPLTQVTPANVGRLLLQWIAPMPQLGLEATPIVVDGILYFSGQNQAYAMDARTGRQIWRYFRPPTPGLVGDASVGTNRGAAILGDKIFVVTDNAHLLALNRVTGKIMWEIVMPEEPEHYGSTVSPLIVRDTVITGVSGGDWGMRGFIACYDTATGKLLWRHWTLPGPGEKGVETWGKDWPRLGGGSTWLTGTYDPGTDTLYWPTGNPWPDSDDHDRPGDNLYTDSILALDPHTGNMKWYFQFTPHDTADRDANEPPVLVDTVYQGKPMKLLLHADRNGFFYVFDRTNGKLLLTKSFLKQLNWATGLDPQGRPLLAKFDGAVPSKERKCPNNAANWSSTAFSPATRFYYFMTIEECHAPGAPADSEEANRPSQRYLRALDIDTGAIRWEIPQPGPLVLKTWSGVVGTASGLIFYSDPNGAFVAVDEKTGKILWHYDTNVGMKGPPMTYAVDGKQFIAVTAGSTLLSFALPSH